MIRHRSRIPLLALWSVTMLSAAAFADQIPSNIKSSTTIAPFRPQIEAVIKKEVAALASATPAVQKKARDNLIFEVDAHVDASATPQYHAEYSMELAKALAPLTSPQTPLRTRLNAAVVAGRVAELVHKSSASDQFAPLAQVLLKDKDHSIVLWGLKTAKYALGSLIANGGNAGPLEKLIVSTTKADKSGPIIEEAYSALTLEPYWQDANIGKFAAATLPDLLDLLQWRAGQYHSGSIPPSPSAERKVDSFLPVTAFAAVNANPAVKNRTLKIMAEMTCAVVHAIADGNTDEELINIAREDGSAMSAFGLELSDTTLASAGQGIKDIPLNPASDLLRARCKSLADALKAQGVTIDTQFGDSGASAGESGTSPSDSATVAGSGK